MRRVPSCASLLAVLSAAAAFHTPPAAADTTLATVTRPARSAHAGRVAWSARDPSTGYFVLMTVTGDTPVQRVPVPPRSVPFDVDLGRTPRARRSRRTRAAIATRRRAGHRSATPLPRCRNGRPRGAATCISSISRPGARPASRARTRRTRPSSCRRCATRVAFARVYERRRGRLGDRAYLYIRGVTGADASRQVPAGNRSRLQTCSGRPVRCLYSVELGPTSLDLAGRRLAFGWDTADTNGPLSSVYLDTLGERRTRCQTLSSLGSGEIQAQELIGPTIDAGRVTWARVLFGDSAENGCAATPCSTAPASGPSCPRPGPPRSCSPCSRSRPTAARSCTWSRVRARRNRMHGAEPVPLRSRVHRHWLL